MSILRCLLLFLISSSLTLTGGWVAIHDLDGVSWLLLASAFITSVVFLRFTWGSWFNVSIIFITFFGLYALSGPYEIIFNTGQLLPFDPPYQVSTWLFANSLALFGFLLGMLGIRLAKHTPRQISMLRAGVNLARPAIGLMLVASCGELVNFIRIGGLPVLLTDKAVYQGAVSNLFLTVPSQEFALLAFGFLGLFLGMNRRGFPAKKYIFFFFISGLPLILINLVLGQRLGLASDLLSLCLGFFYKKQIKRLPLRLTTGLLLFYLIAAPLYAFRWDFPLILSGHPVPLNSAEIVQGTISALNPAKNEFGAPFGNFSTYVNHGGGELQLGLTYLRDLTVAIPGFLFPGEKPIGTTYEFRNTYFPDWAARSPIAGTGFSSVLEAYMNFGMAGIAFVFAVYGSFLAVLERIRMRSKSIYVGVLYTSFSQFALVIHRSSTGDTLSGYLWIIVWIGAVYLVMTTMRGLSDSGPQPYRKHYHVALLHTATGECVDKQSDGPG